MAYGRCADFSLFMMLRYVLETCCRVDVAVAALSRILVAQSQNVKLMQFLI